MSTLNIADDHLHTKENQDRANRLIDVLQDIQNHEYLRRLKEAPQSYLQWIKESWKEGFLRPIILWILWLIMGSCFYANADFEGNYCKGFYYSVNVGYSIGWELDETTQASFFFSTVYIWFGATAIAAVVAMLMESTLNMIQHANPFKETSYSKDQSILSRLIIVLKDKESSIFILYFFFILFGVIFSCSVFNWTVIEGLYFSVSSLSTAGTYHIPPDSKDWVYAIVGFYAATGVPVMGMTMGRIAAYIVKKNHDNKLTRAIATKSSALERSVVDALAINESHKSLTKHEFLVLTLVRVGLVDISVIGRIYDRFDELDVDEDGLLSYTEVFDDVAADGYQQIEMTKNILHQSSSISTISKSDDGSNMTDHSEKVPTMNTESSSQKQTPRRIYIKPKHLPRESV